MVRLARGEELRDTARDDVESNGDHHARESDGKSPLVAGEPDIDLGSDDAAGDAAGCEAVL
jgi:hypothetical protein